MNQSGKGSLERVEEIEVLRPNGMISRLPEPAVDQYHDIPPPSAAAKRRGTARNSS